VTGRIDQVNQKVVAIAVLGIEAFESLFVHLIEQRDTGRLDGNATVLLILSGVSQSGIPSLHTRLLARADDRDAGKRKSMLF
jgi:hypothetical protein